MHHTHTNIAGSRQRVHVDVNCKKDIYEACIDDMRDEMASDGNTCTAKEYDKPVSPDYFLKIPRQHYKVIMHKHKSQKPLAVPPMFVLPRNLEDRT